MKERVLVTGGAGYIGSHTVASLLDAGFSVGVLDNLAKSSIESLTKVREALKPEPSRLCFFQGDINDLNLLDTIFSSAGYHAVIHFAALKHPHESFSDPLLYYENNVTGTVQLLKAMQKHGVKKLVFSSSCTVYGPPMYAPIDENHPLGPTTPYGRTKAFVEDIMRDLANSDPEWSVLLLRYFNPAGAHPGGFIGEDPRVATSLMPVVQNAALSGSVLHVFGTDYSTRDGSCVRDFIHVMDLAEGHVAAVNKVLTDHKGCTALNMGTGVGTTVLELVKAFEDAVGAKVALQLSDRRKGDVEAAWATTGAAEKYLNWQAKRSVEEICKHQLVWARNLLAGQE